MRENDYDRPSGSGWFAGLLWMLSGGAVAALLLFGFSNFQWGDRLFGVVNSLLSPSQPEPKVDVRSLVLQQVKESSELATAAFTMQAVVPTEQDAAVGGFVFGKTKLLYIAHGEVKAGVDLSRITAENVQVSGDTIRIQLPPAQLLDQKIDVNRSQVYDYNRGILGLGPDVGPELQAMAQQEALTKITAAACQEGILQKASDRAKFVVTQLLSTAGYQSVAIDISPAAGSTCSNRVNAPENPPALETPAENNYVQPDQTNQSPINEAH
ncbi:MAG: DUF4230 domain-containing protein [Oscillatoriales cyanobacterium C42_A2020_001]|nr:DUF4230 domain-containing protein [Leptolyngbyaceae cyanobacterium C42_A2020_001]